MKLSNKTKIIIILSNFFLFIVLFFILDICIYYRYLYMSSQYKYPYKGISYIKRISKNFSKEKIEKEIFEQNFRPIENKDSSNAPIILFGCSFVEGHMLNEKETMSYKLGQQANAPIYNRAKGGWGPQHMLFQLRSPLLYKEIRKPSFIIYTFIEDHTTRGFISSDSILYGGLPTFTYKKEGNSLKYSEIENYIFKFPLLCLIKKCIFYTKVSKEQKAEMTKLHFLEAKKAIEKHWKGVPFIIFLFDSNYAILASIDALRDSGIHIITYQELMSAAPHKPEYTISEYDVHPNAKAWDIITPKLYYYINNINSQDITISQYIEKDLLDYFSKNEDEKIKNIKDLITKREFASAFSLCAYDRELIKQKKTTKYRASLAYIIWCFGNFIDFTKTKSVQNFFTKIAKKINPQNSMYNTTN